MGGKKCLCCYQKRRDSRRDSSEESLSSEAKSENESEQKWSLKKRILVWSFATLLILLFLVFAIIWIVIPITFWLSIAFQRLAIFLNIDSPKYPEFDNPTLYDIDGVRNFYITVKDEDNKTLTQIGAWLIIPADKIESSSEESVTEIIENTDYDLLIYLHGVYANRAKPIEQYKVFRRHFMVLAVDHRGYGDSGVNVEMTESGIINDHVQIYKWIMAKNFPNRVYYWGHSLGAALSTHTVRALRNENLVPDGLILESAFTNLTEELQSNFVGKIFGWLPYFGATILNPPDENGFRFRSSSNIIGVDCPIMLLHAEDDVVVPSFLGERLATVAREERDMATQGNVTMHLFSKDHGYGHNDIVIRNENMDKYINDFKAICEST